MVAWSLLFLLAPSRLLGSLKVGYVVRIWLLASETRIDEVAVDAGDDAHAAEHDVRVHKKEVAAHVQDVAVVSVAVEVGHHWSAEYEHGTEQVVEQRTQEHVRQVCALTLKVCVCGG